MILKSEEGRINFIVDTLCSIGLENKGGSIAVHRLAFEIARRGHNVYIFNPPLYPHENISVIPTSSIPSEDGWSSSFSWAPFYYNLDNTVSVYTQITWGNPFGTKHNCRWVLHDYDESHWETFGSDDKIYNYGSFKVPEKTTQESLTVFDYKLETFKNFEGNRKGFCYIIHKFTPEWGRDFLNNFGAEDLTHLMFDGNFEELSQKFNQYEFFLTFDSKSYITTCASLCGCKSVILNPEKGKTPTQYRIENPIQMAGVAYGWEDLKWAEKTIELVEDNIKNLYLMDMKTVDNFLSYWTYKLN